MAEGEIVGGSQKRHATQRTCWLHIGAPKTGSTALQQFLSAQGERLLARGLAYPRSILRGWGHHDLAFTVSGGYPDWAIPQEKTRDQLLAALAEELRRSPLDAILSSENFYLLCAPGTVAEALAELGFEPGAVRIAVYVRRQDDAQMSWYNQRVKAQGYVGTLEESIEDSVSLWDYAAHLDKWAAVFGEASLRVRSYQRSDLAGGDICRDFVRLLGLPESGFTFADEPINTGLNRDLLEFQRLVNRLPFTVPDKRRFRVDLMELSRQLQGSGVFDERPLMEGRARRALLERYSDGNRHVARRFLGRDALFDESMPDEGARTAGKPGLDVEKLATLVAWLLARRESSPPTRL